MAGRGPPTCTAPGTCSPGGSDGGVRDDKNFYLSAISLARRTANALVRFRNERSMTPLRPRMLEDMEIRNLAPHTQASCNEHVARFASTSSARPAARAGSEHANARLPSSFVVVLALRWLHGRAGTGTGIRNPVPWLRGDYPVAVRAGPRILVRRTQKCGRHGSANL